MNHNHIDQFVFTGCVLREGRGFTALCPELDVASQGRTPEDAKEALLEAVSLYLETAFEHNLPYLRPVPPDANPLLKRSAKRPLNTFQLKVDFAVNTHA